MEVLGVNSELSSELAQSIDKAAISLDNVYVNHKNLWNLDCTYKSNITCHMSLQ